MPSRPAILLLGMICSSAAWSAADPPTPSDSAVAGALRSASSNEQDSCARQQPGEIVVCGRSPQPYRIDPAVLAATRAAEAPPPKPALDAQAALPCTGPQCGGGTIPLIGMALTALKAAELAAQGDDWRDALRTRPDQYRVYEKAKGEESKPGAGAFGVSAGNK